MTRLRRSLKSLANPALLNLFLILIFISGCSSAIQPTFLIKDVTQAVQNICKKEHNIDVRAKLVDSTLWVYIPFQDVLVKAEKPERYLERFQIADATVESLKNQLKLQYIINKVPEKEKFQDYVLNKEVTEKVNKVWTVLRRVIFSMERSDRSPKFFCLVTADIKTGLYMKYTFYCLDLKKLVYGLISLEEFQHRNIQDTEYSPLIINDPEGARFIYKEVTMEDFISKQIQQRVRLKFGKPEVGQDADIDKEIIKLIVFTLKAYNYRNFTEIELYNMVTDNKTSLSETAIWAGTTE